MEDAFLSQLVREYASVGFVQRPLDRLSFDALVFDASTFGRGFPVGLLDWFEWFGGDPPLGSSMEGVQGFLPVTAEFALQLRLVYRQAHITSFLSEVMVPILMDGIGTVVLAYLPPLSMGECLGDPMVFAKCNDSMLCTSFGFMFSGVLTLFKTPQGANWDVLPAQFD
jgi:hypothetical protein